MTGQPGDNSQLKTIVERIEHINVEIKDLQTGRAEIYTEAKSAGFDVPALRAIVRARAEDADKRRAREEHEELYRNELGVS
jgi:uncharacterized protein (UPF0335 family)